MKKLLANILFISFVTIAFLYGIISVAVEELDVKMPTTEVVGYVTTSNFTRGTAAFDDITTFPINATVFNASVDHFCIQHGVAYGGHTSKYDMTLGTGKTKVNEKEVIYDWHVENSVTSHNKPNGVTNSTSEYIEDDKDTSASFYIYYDSTTHKVKLNEPENIDSCIGYKDNGETPSDYVYTNWLYHRIKDVTFGCPNNCADALEDTKKEEVELAYLLAAYKASGKDNTTDNGQDGKNNTYPRGSYSNDPLQTAVWDSWLNQGNGAHNKLASQAEAYWKYHQETADPKINVTLGSDCGTTIEGSNYKVGPFQMSAYKRAKGYTSGKISTTVGSDSEEDSGVSTSNPNASYNSGEETLQDIFGDELIGGIIKATAVVTNESGETGTFDFTIPEPSSTFYVTLSASDVAKYDELIQLQFVYQRVHVYGNGTKYIGEQYLLTFDQNGNARNGSRTGTDRGCSSYDCTAEGCYHTGLTWSQRSASGATHAFYCQNTTGGSYCENGNNQGKITSSSDAKNGCSYNWACGKTPHTHGASCYHSHTDDCKHSHTADCAHSHNNSCTKHTHNESSCYRWEHGVKTEKLCPYETGDYECNKQYDCGKTTADYDCGKTEGTSGTLECEKEEHSHTWSSCGKNHDCTKEYCVHGHKNGQHTVDSNGQCAGKSWGSKPHTDNCSGDTKCTHGHLSCEQFTWKKSGSEADKCQDGFAGAGDFGTEVRRYDIDVHIPLKTNMSIYKYITQVKHVETGGEEINVTSRANMDKGAKEKDPVKIEKGDVVFYTVKLQNTSRFPTKVRVKDTLPKEYQNYKITNNLCRFAIEGSSGLVDSATWIEVNAKSSLEIEMQLEALGSDSVKNNIYENKVEFYGEMRYGTWFGHSNGQIVNTNNGQLTDSDYYSIKEYNVSIDKYITEIKHTTNGVKTFDSKTARKLKTDDTKKSDVPYAEYGDTITYNIDIYNTTNKDRNKEPYWDPDLIYVDVTDTLPNKYSSLSVQVDGKAPSTQDDANNKITISAKKEDEPNESSKKSTFKLENVPVPKNGKATITVTIVVEESVKDTLEKNEITINEVKNVNKMIVNNHSKDTTTADYYKINDYKLTLDKYISKYNAEKTAENKTNGFANETNTLSDRYSMTEEQKQNAPVQVEKGETLVYSIKLSNDDVKDGNKLATQVRPKKIKDAMEYGLSYKSAVANIYDKDGKPKYTNIKVNCESLSNNEYTFEIEDMINKKYLVLEPTDYMVYEITVEVTKTNMFLSSIKNTASIVTLTNINSTKDKTRDVTPENTATQQVSSEYVKMKDLIIAGRVWLDRDKDGYIGKAKNGVLEVDGNAIDVESATPARITDKTGKEYAMKNVPVKLYEVIKEKDINTKQEVVKSVTLVRETKTDEKGYFTFAKNKDGQFYAGAYSATASGVTESAQRIDKATAKDANKNYTSNSNLLNYYIEYEYDGLIYMSTEVYSDTQNIGVDGEVGNNYKLDSNAAEFEDVRNNFNKQYEIIGYNKAYVADLSSSKNLSYTKDNHKSYLQMTDDRTMFSRSFINAGTDQSIENTKLLWLRKQTTEDKKPETEYLKYINLGLQQRDNIDLDLTQDVYELKTTINGEEMKYEYNQNNYTLKTGEIFADANRNVNKAIDKSQGNPETEESKLYNSEFYMTGYKDDNSSLEANRKLYEFEYYLEDYNYRVSQYSIDTVRKYKGSPSRDFNANAISGGESVLLDNANGRESELNTEITFRIKVTSNEVVNDNIISANLYAGVNEIVEYYDTDFVNLALNDDGSVKGFNIKTKDSNGYLVNKELKVVSAKAVMKDGSEKPVTLTKDSLYNATRTIQNGGEKLYDTLYIRPANNSNGVKAGDFLLGRGESLDILITFVVEKEVDEPDNVKEIATILGNKENVAEISAYSTYYKKNEYVSAGLIDVNSNPGNFGEPYKDSNGNIISNAISGDYVKFIEDDTFRTGITLKIPTPTPDPDPEEETRYQNNVQRTLEGFVWDDARTNTATDDKGTQYIGDGTYDTSVNAIAEAKKNQAFKINDSKNKEDNDFGAKDIKAQLIEVIKMPDPNDPSVERVYEETIFVNGNTGEGASVMIARTANDGSYKFKGYVPGEYIVRFTYGDKDISEDANNLSAERLIFNGQDYKSTSYQVKEGTYAEYAQGSGDKTAGDIRLEILEKPGNSDAKDDEIRRLEVISYSEKMNNEKNSILRGKDSTNKNALLSNTYMNAETPDFLVRTEKEIRKVTVLTFQEYRKKITEITTSSRFNIHNIDFGLQYRPELQIVLNKYISDISITTSDANSADSSAPLVHAVFDEYYGVVRNTDFVTGATTFITNAEGQVIKVNPNGSNADIEAAINAGGGNIGNAQKNNDGTYVIAVAGTEFNTKDSVGLENVTYLPNKYEKNADGTQALERDSRTGKYIVKATQGFAYIVMDDSIMQGATIKIKYLFTGTNISETDRISSNLSDLRFEGNAEVEKYAKLGGSQYTYYGEVEYQLATPNDKPSFVNESYSAAMTARNALFSEYYRYDLNSDNSVGTDINGKKVLYRVKPKDIIVDNNKVVAITDINKAPNQNNPHSGMNGYYGRYLGSTYYTGKINSAMEVIAELKLDKILDYVDNNLVLNDNDNKGVDSLWKTTTSGELYTGNMLSKHSYTYFDANGKVTSGITDKYKLVDADGIAYDTDERSNLAISLDDRVRDDVPDAQDNTVNKSFSKFLLPRYVDSNHSFGIISLTASKVLSPEDKSDDMAYENIAEIIEYSSVTGRVTNLATTIGNAKIEDIRGESPEFHEGRVESDTASVERVTLTPPTGLNRIDSVVRNVVEKASYTIFIIIGIGIVCVGVMVSITLYHKRRIK